MTAVLIPGFMLTDDLWSDVAPALEPFGPLVHADPGVGASIEDVAHRTLEASPARFILVGFSMGGYIAREIVYGAPERVSHLILISTSARGDGELQARRRAEAAAVGSKAYGGVSRHSIRRSLAPDREQDARLIERIHRMSLELGDEVFRRQVAFRRVGDGARLADISCPTLIVAGRHDRLRSLDEARELQSGIAGARLVILDAGHMIPLEAPAELARAIRHFLRDDDKIAFADGPSA